jgi:hypothetical protein
MSTGSEFVSGLTIEAVMVCGILKGLLGLCSAINLVFKTLFHN